MRRYLCALVLCLNLAACLAAPSDTVTRTSQVRQAPRPALAPQPASGGERWIEVDLAQQMVRLREGQQVVGEYLAATGKGDSAATLTYTGTFTVYAKIKGPTYLPDFDVYVTDWVGFDEKHAIGFHSLPKNQYGQVVDSRLGEPVSHGCVRVGNSAAVYNFARLGMQVVVRQSALAPTPTACARWNDCK